MKKSRVTVILLATILCVFLLTTHVSNTATGEAQVKLILATKYLRDNQYQKAILSYGEGIVIAYRDAFYRLTGRTMQGGPLTVYDYIPAEGLDLKYNVSVVSNGVSQNSILTTSWVALGNSLYERTELRSDGSIQKYQYRNDASKGITNVGYDLQVGDASSSVTIIGQDFIMQYAVPGSSWTNNYTSAQSSKDGEMQVQQVHDSEYVFVGWENITLLGEEIEAAHVICKRTSISSSRQSTTTYDEWFARGLGSVKVVLHETSTNRTRDYIAELTSIE